MKHKESTKPNSEIPTETRFFIKSNQNFAAGICFSYLELKEEKDGVKAEETTKLQNGENTKEGATAAPVVNVSEEKKKATKQRFMFNIADGGFTGGEMRVNFFLFFFFSVLSLTFFPFLFRASLSVAE